MTPGPGSCSCKQGLLPGLHLPRPNGEEVDDVWSKIPFPANQCLPIGLILKADSSLDEDMQISFSRSLPKWSREFVPLLIGHDCESRPNADDVLKILNDFSRPYEAQIAYF